MSDWFRMDDQPGGNKLPIATARDEAARWNTPELGFGIFATVNSFDGPRRKEHLRRINAWAIDIVTGSKEQMQRRLEASPLVPSLVVETRRGFQAWWGAKDGQAEHWNAVVVERLVPFFGAADVDAGDICRMLRVPGSWSFDGLPFRCRAVWKHDVGYTERQLAQAFKWVRNTKTVAAMDLGRALGTWGSAAGLVDTGTERALVGALVRDPDLFDRLPDEFGIDRLSDLQALRILQAVVNMRHRGGAVSLATVRAELERVDGHCDHQWLDVVVGCRDTAPPDELVIGWANRAIDLAARRAAALAAERPTPPPDEDEIDAVALRDCELDEQRRSA